MKRYTCCLTGHRTLYESEAEIMERLRAVLIDLINSGYRFFGVGGARGFDSVAARAIISLKKEYPHIKLIIVLPCADHTSGWNENDVKIYERIRSHADKIRILSDRYYNGCMLVRNRHLVNYSSVCMCYKRKEAGGTAYTVNYAIKNDLKIIEI